MTGHQKRILEIIRGQGPALSGAEFGELALATYRLQRERNPLYRRLCESREKGAAPKDWREVPAIPVSAFKAGHVAAFDPKRCVRVFKTSGTTQGKRGEHRFETLEFYDAAIRTLFKRHVLPDMDRISIVNLVPSAAEAPESSLAYMAGFAAEAFGGGRFLQAPNVSRSRNEAVISFLREEEEAGRPVLIFATTLAFSAFLEFLAGKEVFLESAPGSRVMETGGSKTSAREVSRPAMLELARRHLGIDPPRVVNEYGMTELSSQFYDRPGTSIKEIPGWARVRVIDPETDEEVKGRGTRDEGREGLIQIFDLANQGSCMAVQTEDAGRLVDGGFEIIGRRPGSDLRGCSLSFEEMKSLGEVPI